MAEVSEVQQVRLDLSHEIQVTRRDLRQELKDSAAELRQEIKDSVAELRKEMHDEFADVRSEMRDGFAEMREEFKHIHYLLAVNAEGMSVLLKQSAEVKQLRQDMNEVQADMRVVKSTVALHSKQLASQA
jgi:hypothetical protein